MLFPTIEFTIFFIAVFTLTWLSHSLPKSRKVFLTLASYFFYGYWDWRFTILLFNCSLGNWICGRLLQKNEENEKNRKIILIVSIIFNLGVLFFFKYYNFFATSFIGLFNLLGLKSHIPTLNIILPVGISFFTFQAMSYTIDVYRREIPPAKSLMDILLYVSFFPQLVAGPIVRAKDFIPQLKTTPDPKNIMADKAVLLIIAGLFKKVFVANYLATLLVDPVFENPMAYSSMEALFGVYGYAIQIYCDFSAYSDIAIGIAALLGYHFPQNFAHPYRAASLREFWRRWHISLSTWLRDYLYIPLGGSKNGKLSTYKNLLITMLLGGLWHGAAWNFFFWGLLHGSGLALERLFSRNKSSPIKRIITTIFTFHFVCLSWIFFRSPSFELTGEYFSAFLNRSTTSTLLTPFVLILIAGGIGIHFFPDNMGIKIKELYNKIPLPFQGLLFGAFLMIMGAVAPDGVAPFIYFQF